MSFERLIHSVCADFAPRKLTSSASTLSCVLISQNAANASIQKVAHT